MSDLTELFNTVFTSPAGRRVLEDLRFQFYEAPKLATKDPHETVVRAAQRDVVQYILDNVEGRDE